MKEGLNKKSNKEELQKKLDDLLEVEKKKEKTFAATKSELGRIEIKNKNDLNTLRESTETFTNSWTANIGAKAFEKHAQTFSAEEKENMKVGKTLQEEAKKEGVQTIPPAAVPPEPPPAPAEPTPIIATEELIAEEKRKTEINMAKTKKNLAREDWLKYKNNEDWEWYQRKIYPTQYNIYKENMAKREKVYLDSLSEYYDAHGNTITFEDIQKIKLQEAIEIEKYEREFKQKKNEKKEKANEKKNMLIKSGVTILVLGLATLYFTKHEKWEKPETTQEQPKPVKPQPTSAPEQTKEEVNEWTKLVHASEQNRVITKDTVKTEARPDTIAEPDNGLHLIQGVPKPMERSRPVNLGHFIGPHGEEIRRFNYDRSPVDYGNYGPSNYSSANDKKVPAQPEVSIKKMAEKKTGTAAIDTTKGALEKKASKVYQNNLKLLFPNNFDVWDKSLKDGDAGVFMRMTKDMTPDTFWPFVEYLQRLQSETGVKPWDKERCDNFIKRALAEADKQDKLKGVTIDEDVIINNHIEKWPQ
jgi:hypothetical protein